MSECCHCWHKTEQHKNYYVEKCCHCPATNFCLHFAGGRERECEFGTNKQPSVAEKRTSKAEEGYYVC